MRVSELKTLNPGEEDGMNDRLIDSNFLLFLLKLDSLCGAFPTIN